MSLVRSHVSSNFFLVIVRFLETFAGSMSSGLSLSSFVLFKKKKISYNFFIVLQYGFVCSLLFCLWIRENCLLFCEPEHDSAVHLLNSVGQCFPTTFLYACKYLLVSYLFYFFSKISFLIYWLNYILVSLTISIWWKCPSFSYVLFTLLDCFLPSMSICSNARFLFLLKLTNDALQLAWQVLELDLLLLWYPFTPNVLSFSFVLLFLFDQ